MHRHAEVQADRNFRQARLSAVSLVLAVYGLVGWYATRSLPPPIRAAAPEPVMSFSLLPAGSPDPESSGSRMRVSTTAEPEPEPAIERQPPQPSGLERQPTQPPELIAQATPTPDASADQAVKIPVSSPEIKAVRVPPRAIRSSGPTTPVKPTPRQSTPQHSDRADHTAGAMTPTADASPGAVTTALNASSTASNAAAPGPVVVSHLDYDGSPPRPVYPQHALRARQQGLVVIRVVIGKDGSVVRADVRRSSGFELLDAAAVSAALRTKFHPYSRNGIAFSASADLPFNFVVKP